MNIFVIVLNVGKDGKPVQRTIADLKGGEIAYTVPWALSELESGCSFIKKSYHVYPEAGGSASLKIKRQGRTILVDESTFHEKIGTANWKEEDCWPVEFEDRIISHFVF